MMPSGAPVQRFIGGVARAVAITRSFRLRLGPSVQAALFLLTVSAFFASIDSWAAAIRFTDVTDSAGIDFNFVAYPPGGSEDHIGGGGAAEDFDRDGWVDLFLTQSDGDPSHLYMNNRDGTFREEAGLRGADLTGRGHALGAAAADYDNDGDIDLFVTFLYPPHVLLINTGGGFFATHPTRFDLPGFSATSPSWGDVDNDGLLELAIGQWNRTSIDHAFTLYRNLGAGQLEPYEFRATPRLDLLVFSPRFADLNSDGWSDLTLTADFGSSQLYVNLGGGIFENRTVGSGTGHDRAGMGASIADYDDDGDLDWFVSSISINNGNVGNRLYRNRGDAIFDDVSDEAGINDGIWGWGTSFGDLDLDGDLDIYHVTGWPIVYGNDHLAALLFENLGGRFVDVAAAAGVANDGEGRGMAFFDYDNDGDLDLIIMVNGVTIQPARPFLYRNDTVTSNHWLKVILRGAPPLHRDGIGSRVYITTGGVTQMRELHASTNYMAQEPGRIAHFGLGDAAVVEQIRAEWINGDTTLLANVSADQPIELPSPSARLSARTVVSGQEITASAQLVVPLGNRREWIVEGGSYADPLAYTFIQPGPKQLRLNLYELDGATLLRAEIVRIMVVPAKAGARSSRLYE